MASYLDESERICVGIEELEKALLGSDDKCCIATIAEHVLDEGEYHRFVVNEKLCGKHALPNRQGMRDMNKKGSGQKK